MLPANENNISNVIENNFLDSDLKIINFYYLRGGFDYNKLKWEDKLHIDYDVSLAKYGDPTSKYSVMRRLYKRKFDFVKEDNLLKLLQDAREYLKD